MFTLLKKWSPDAPECYFQHYFYNNVGAERVPYYGPSQGEDEQKWEAALAKKPDENAVPVLCKGFGTLGERLRLQVQAVQGLQARLHEINNSLTAQQQGHDLDISVRAADAKRRHIAQSQRCLRLATKVQVLRNRGYVMDSAEEALKKKLVDLEKGAFDPSLSGRQDEVWARLVGIRERARLLQSEMDKTKANAGNAGNGSEDSLDEEVLRRTKKVGRQVPAAVFLPLILHRFWATTTPRYPTFIENWPRSGRTTKPGKGVPLLDKHGCGRRLE